VGALHGIRLVRLVKLVFLACVASACVRAPSPLVPTLEGSIGVPHRGVLTAAAELPRGDTLRWLRENDRHWAIPRFTKAIERAANAVAEARPGSPPLTVGDLSVRTGGVLLPHFSHRTGRDADVLLYVTTLDGAPIESPGFVHFGPDGLAFDEKHQRYLRFDVEREWLLIRALVEDDDARIQWIFANHVIEALVIEWARAKGEPAETIWRAETAMVEPNPGGAHDDHVHVRTACTLEEIARGCEPTGPVREWIDAPSLAPALAPDAPAAPDARDARDADNAALVLDLLRPLDAPAPVTMTQ